MKFRIFNSISEIPSTQWNQILQRQSLTYRHEFWEILEQAGLNDFSYQHILFYDANAVPVGLASFYTITTDLAIFAPPWLRRLLQQIRRTFPGFLKVKMLECGTPITLNCPCAAKTETAKPDIIKVLTGILLAIAKNQGHFLLVMRDFEAQDAILETDLRKLGFHWVDSLPTTYLDIVWATPAAYLAAMKSYYRSKLLKHLRINAAQHIRHELRENFADLADELCRQWLVVHQHASEYQREVLSPAFYREFSAKLGSHSKVLLFYRQDELIGHALLLQDGKLLRWLYFGRSQADNDSLYIYAAHQVILSAIQLGASRLEMGLTTYALKKDLGAYMSPIKLALRAPQSWINPFVGLVYPLINHTPPIANKVVFKY